MTALTPGGHVDEARRYVLESRIATGGMGEVWAARDTVLDRPVAVKVLKAEYADDATFHARFETEARNAAALHHSGIAAVYDYGDSSRDDGSATPRPYLVMELVDGQPLSVLLRPSAPLDPTAVQDLLAQAATALGVAHAAGIVHRDVKPANLLITPDRRVKVTDFGIARAADGMALTETGQVLGTPAYISPEQAEGGTATAASDVYSLGVVAFECLAGRKPFLADTPVATAIAHLRNPVPDLPDSVPADLARVVRRSMSKAPEDRFEDGAAFAAALRDPGSAAAAAVVAPVAVPGVVAGGDSTQVIEATAAAPVPVPAPAPAPAPAPSPDSGRRTPWPLVIGLVAVALVVLLAVWFGTRDSSAPTDEPTDEPSRSPSQSPTGTPTDPPSETPSESPTKSPTQTPTETPTESPSETPTETPTESPTESPTETPTETPTTETPAPTETPTTSPSQSPSQSPSASASPSAAGSRTTSTDGEDEDG